jgi:RNA polymerase sigma-70 factor, ECF subfamily
MDTTASTGVAAMTKLDEQLRGLIAAGHIPDATTLVLRELGPEILGFLSGVLGDDDGDEVFSAFSEALWRSLGTFRSQCAVRTWAYMLARQAITHHERVERRHVMGRVPISELADVLEAVRKTYTTLAAQRRTALTELRNELSIEDRTLLILRVDRNLPFEEIAVAFAGTPADLEEPALQREAARLRKRFQLVKERLIARAKAIQPEP